jgi:hypothetical protein
MFFSTTLIEQIIDIPPMSSGAPHRLIEKKGKQLSKFLGIDSVPSTQLIANMQSRINNPIFKLSMTDYEDMCGNKMMVRMMSKVIGCEEKQLKKFCKYINVFAENIESSPKYIKNKMKVTNGINASKRRGSLRVLPDDILEKIVEKYNTIFKIKYKLKDWIPPEKLNFWVLSQNPNAIDLLNTNQSKIKWNYLSKNPNPEAIKLLKANKNKIVWEFLSENPNPEAIELLRTNPSKIDWGWLSENPNPEAIELLKENQDKIDWDALSANSGAIELLNANRNKINWEMLSANPAAMDLLKENPDEIDWGVLSSNPNAMDLLTANPSKIKWRYLSKNPNPEAIKLLKTNLGEIDWYLLSANPAAIELLKENRAKINWNYFSVNPSIFDEILE